MSSSVIKTRNGRTVRAVTDSGGATASLGARGEAIRSGRNKREERERFSSLLLEHRRRAKTERLTMFMFCLLAKDDSNTNTASTINTLLSPPPPPSLALSARRLAAIHPWGLPVTVMAVAALPLRKPWRGTNEQTDTQSVNVSLSRSTNQTSLLAASSC